MTVSYKFFIESQQFLESLKTLIEFLKALIESLKIMKKSNETSLEPYKSLIESN